MRKCKRHPTYKAMRKPRSGCATCAEMYLMKRKLIKDMKERTW